MNKMLITLAALGTVAMASPAMAGGWSSSGGGHSSHYCGCGDRVGQKMCGTSTSSSSNGSTSTGSTSTGSTGTSSGSSGNQVPEPGMLGMAGAGLIALALLRRRKERAAA